MPRAFVCRKFGPIESHKIEEIPTPKLKRGNVLIDVQACGVNYPDTLIIQGLYQLKPPFPFSPGGEVAGVITAVGPGAKNLKVGQNVLVLSGFGGFSEQIAVHWTQCVPYPSSMSYEEASSLFLTYGTTLYALEYRAKIKKGDVCLVLGASGGTGTACIEIAKAKGATVIACASTQEKLEFCKSVGADHLINYKTEDLRKRIKQISKRGVDIVYDPVGGEFTEPAIKSLAFEGKYLIIGFTAGIPKIRANLALLKSAQLIGIFWGRWMQERPRESKESVVKLMEMYSKGQIKPRITKIYTLDESMKALEAFQNRTVKGKIVISMRKKAQL